MAFNLIREHLLIFFFFAGLHLFFENTEAKILSQQNNSSWNGRQLLLQLLVSDVSHILHTKILFVLVS